jgi:hypothetical protein
MRTHSETDSCHTDTHTDKISTISVVEHSDVKTEGISISEGKPELESCLAPTQHLANHVLFWHTIQQQLATKLLIQQQQQVQLNHLHIKSSPITRPPKFSM